MTTRRTVTIAGGGIAGLALAAALDPERFDVTVLEPRVDLPQVATSLAMWPEAQRALAELGVLERLAEVSPILTRFPLKRFDGRPFATSDVPPSPLVGRRDLLAALDAAVPPDVRRVPGRFGPDLDPAGSDSDSDSDSDAVARDDTPAGAGIVVGADGVHSAVRRRFWPRQADAVATDFLAVRGVLPDRVAAADLGEYWGRGQLFGIGPHRSGTNWYMSFRSRLGPRGVDVEAALREARARAADDPRTAPAIHEVLDAATSATTLAQRIWLAPPLPRYTRGRCVLIGDAAHAMTPNLGRGGCEALIDAVALARLLARHPVEEAFAAYDRERRRRTRRLAATSVRLARVALAERLQPVRDVVLGGVSVVTGARRAEGERVFAVSR